jgi:hypothetical protein
MDANKRPRCPKCGGCDLVALEAKLYRCERCKMLTDCQDDGDIGYRSQGKYAERKEEFELRQRERLSRRFADRRSRR